ncbi:MAG TPA: homoserine dehydrogenase [Thermoanaerobaculales bacterium]|nr:homoserine dehydrogenase [Thermoanaerobaculales bacterium]HPA80128.1 homoserine dehydrogenase [Thermoanaerobaculales bacterium]HQL30286.1 homoserine dehydrogenase [Thermoanaerobaculales bacterium]HQN94948.1 homoserine dehydrogenase [Thermoanaerobaculales bacterium]HQP42908.1 homoserine dehydrogenase [Thermoanaerobaculales bacterium]
MRLLFIGFGTVGQGLSELLLAKREELAQSFGFDAVVVGIADMLKGSAYDPDGLDLAEALARVGRGESLSDWTGVGQSWDAPTMIAEADADAMIEATYTDITTGQPATDHIRAALERGMHVTTTNKGPLALHSKELIEIARESGLQLLYEGTVMAGTPLLGLIRETLAGSTISEMRGILNGTTNYILTQMEGGMDYQAALAQAQQLGYAEAVPDADVLGLDALAKVTILANVVFGANLRPSDSPCQGITEISSADISQAASDGQRYKLIGRVWRDEHGVHASVAPQRLPLSHPLAGVGGATNAMTITTDALGEVTIIGPGAGRRQTGFALLADLLTMWRHS